ncbi:DUF2846 domain-containing protein [Colwelliaceae bacterium 6471]
MFKKIIFLLSTLLLLLACNATGPKFSNLEAVNNKTALVYIYRPWMMLDGAAAPAIQVDGVDRFDMNNGGFQIIHLPPGKHKLTVRKSSINWRADEMSFEYPFEAGKRYFVRLTAELGDFGSYGGVVSISGAYYFGLVTEEVALHQLKELKQN